MRVALAQIAPVLLDREGTLHKVCAAINRAADAGAELVCFGEALVPGYPAWLCRTDAARFNADDQKEIFARYSDQAVRLDRRRGADARGDLAGVAEISRRLRITAVLGVVERAEDRSGHSLYCSCVLIDPTDGIRSVHRKLMPTYEERLVWGVGDGAGLVAHPVGPFRLGALNCWENWMPLARAALYAQGVDLHVALWPGAVRNTREITRYIALESRSYVLSVSGLLLGSDVARVIPACPSAAGEIFHDGGSCIAGPDGSWIVEPVVGREEIILADLAPALVRRERQNFDPMGHYSRPDVLQLTVDRRRQRGACFIDPR